MKTGLEVCLSDPPPLLTAARFGLLVNQASLDRHFVSTATRLHDGFPGQLKALFAPQHGFWGLEQANMVESLHARHPRLGIPIHSLYCQTRRPSPEMLADLDLLVVDLQDVGTRVYTFVWSVLHCLHAAARADVAVLILDRPNPLGGALVEGAVLNAEFRSFVGGACIPMRHGLTMAELARWLNDSLDVPAELHSVALQGWRRESTFPQTQLPWVPPSPNLPTFASALVYPGQVLLEGTNLSEGRGTTMPFELCGAPFVDADLLADRMNGRDLPGVVFRAVRFRPSFDKWCAQTCGGVAIHVNGVDDFRPYRTTLELLSAIRELFPDDFAWTPPPYEYETEKMPIDILSGDERLRAWLDEQGTLTREQVETLCNDGLADWQHATSAYRQA